MKVIQFAVQAEMYLGQLRGQHQMAQTLMYLQHLQSQQKTRKYTMVMQMLRRKAILLPSTVQDLFMKTDGG